MAIHYNTYDNYLRATSLDMLHGLGVDLETGNDFEEYRRLLSLGRPDHVLGVPFEPKRQQLTEDNSYWIVGRDQSGAIMHTQAMKCLKLDDGRLSDYLYLNLREFEPSSMDIDYSRSSYRPGPGARRMRGSVVYHGEFWIGGKPGQYRGTRLSSLLARHAFLTAMQTWNPDYFFGFMSEGLVFKGFSARFGYMHTDPNAIRYVLNGSDEVLDGMMGYNANEDMRFILDMPVSEALHQAA